MEITEYARQVLDQSAGPIGLIECIEISHPKWGVFRYATNTSNNLVLRHENGVSYTYQAAAINITRGSSGDNLDQKISFTLNDLGETIPDLIDLIIDDEVLVLPTVAYRGYLTNNLNAPALINKDLELTGINRDKNGSQGDASAPGLNDSGNGDLYTPSSDPGLKGFYP